MVKGTKYETNIQSILVQMLNSGMSYKDESVAPPPDEFSKQLSKFLVMFSDKSQISENDIENICCFYTEDHSRRPI